MSRYDMLIRQSYNWTLLELKLVSKMDEVLKVKGYNWTLLELKFLFIFFVLMLILVIIEPYWNWNF